MSVCETETEIDRFMKGVSVSLFNQNIRQDDVEQIDKMYDFFKSNSELILENWNIKEVTDVRRMLVNFASKCTQNPHFINDHDFIRRNVEIIKMFAHKP